MLKLLYLRNVFEGTKLVFGIFFQESSTCYTNQAFESPLDITIVLSLKRDWICICEINKKSKIQMKTISFKKCFTYSLRLKIDNL